jgi:hypothetical protein
MRDVLVGALTAAMGLLAGSQFCHAMTVTELYGRTHAAIVKLRVYCPDGSGGTGSGLWWRIGKAGHMSRPITTSLMLAVKRPRVWPYYSATTVSCPERLSAAIRSPTLR